MRVAILAVLLVVGVHLLIGQPLGAAFDGFFVALCVTAALWVHPRDFFTVGVLPPLLLGATVLVLALFAPWAVAQPDDSAVQAFVSGLAHRSIGLGVGYALTLGVLGLRQIALRNRGTLRRRHATRAATPSAPAAADVILTAPAAAETVETVATVPAPRTASDDVPAVPDPASGTPTRHSVGH